MTDIVSTHVQGLLFQQAADRLRTQTYTVASYAEMKSRLESGDRDKVGFFLVPWKDDAANEAFIKEDCRATIRCFPMDLNEPGTVKGRKCFYSGQPATHIAMFARAF
jgi:prolyl-tRNA synthetase